jgi:hypothetical protein
MYTHSVLPSMHYTPVALAGCRRYLRVCTLNAYVILLRALWHTRLSKVLRVHLGLLLSLQVQHNSSTLQNSLN